MGLYYETLEGTYRARNCDNNAYGVANRTYGLSPAPCRVRHLGLGFRGLMPKPRQMLTAVVIQSWSVLLDSNTHCWVVLCPPHVQHCPADMVASRSAAYPRSAAYYNGDADGTGGFADEMACVTKPGVGVGASMALVRLCY